jgi:hypothetical protein
VLKDVLFYLNDRFVNVTVVLMRTMIVIVMIMRMGVMMVVMVMIMRMGVMMVVIVIVMMFMRNMMILTRFLDGYFPVRVSASTGSTHNIQVLSMIKYSLLIGVSL